jgi:hypothetical protein
VIVVDEPGAKPTTKPRFVSVEGRLVLARAARHLQGKDPIPLCVYIGTRGEGALRR